MPIFDLPSKRQKKSQDCDPDTYRYDDIPEKLRTQIFWIMGDVLGKQEQYDKFSWSSGYIHHTVRKSYDDIRDYLCREYGELRLTKGYRKHKNKMKDLVNFFLQENDVGRALDIIELSFHFVDTYTRNPSYLNKSNPSEVADQAIQELNERFKEHGVGYYYTNGKIIRVDDEFIHSEVVRPALGILNRKEYAGAQEEFLQAHKHYREGRIKEALNECLKSIESVMKSICDKRGWNYDQRMGANKLIEICFDNGIVPQFWKSHFDALRSLLEGGVPPARNKLSGHGQGTAPKPVPQHIASYVLHMTAAAIVFLAEADSART